MSEPLNILVIEDHNADFLMVERHLKQNGLSVRCSRVDSLEGLNEAIDRENWDLVLSDYNVPQLNFLDSLNMLQADLPDLPVIMVTGTIGEEKAVELLKLGVQDFVIKENLTRLIPAIERSMKDAAERRSRIAAEDALRQSEEMYRSLFSNMLNGFAYCRIILDGAAPLDFVYLNVNDAFEKLTGLRNVYGKRVTEVIPGIRESDPEFFDRFCRVAMTGKPERFELYVEALKIWFWISVNCPAKGYFIAIFDVITARKRAEAESKQLMAAIEQAGDNIVMTDAQGIIQFVNPAFEGTTGYSREEAVGRSLSILKSGEQDELFYRDLWDTISGGRIWAGRMVNKCKDGTLYTQESTISPVRDALGRIVNYVAVTRDITEHLRLAAQFQQAQKMEAIGLLAGGVAHDFNNMLTVILGYTELALHKVDPSQPLHANLEEIYKAAQRSSDITRQLLAFSRKQTIIPVVLDLNMVVESMLKMLRRLIGENINLVWLPEASMSPVKMDPGQIDQILVNLCINARDAVADVGKVTIETGTTLFDETHCAHNAGFVAGEYVLLAVSDDGCGMDKEMIDKIFEPFFTSKGVGQGTGLGLSTVYGIVKQNNGFINVYSEPGKGTTFKIYLPRYAGRAEDAQRETAVEIPLNRGETLLLVEDEPAILTMCTMILEQLGYRVLAAGSPSEAIGLAEKHASEIHLLITDVVMPGMNGRDLAERLHALFPRMEILFMSGYTSNVLAHRGVLDEGMNFIQKPFSMKSLAVKVRDALEDKLISPLT
jgi:PAS domain S-box-containing protein